MQQSKPKGTGRRWVVIALLFFAAGCGSNMRLDALGDQQRFARDWAYHNCSNFWSGHGSLSFPRITQSRHRKDNTEIPDPAASATLRSDASLLRPNMAGHLTTDMLVVSVRASYRRLAAAGSYART